MNVAARSKETTGHRVADAPVGWGAALIDEQGNEVPITESMVERACDELSRTWTFPRITVLPNPVR